MFLMSSYLGYVIGKNYSKREKFYGELLMLCNVLITNIRFNKNKLKIIINEFMDNCSNDMCEYLHGYLRNDMEELSFISKYDNKRIKDFFSRLGEFDSGSEIGYIENSKIYFNDCYMKSMEDNKKYGVMYTKLGFMAGLILVILFI